jgi:1-acyl-sn-glycerol-3-phosphate acyltransferase
MVKKIFGMIQFLIAVIYTWLLNVAFVKDKKNGRISIKKFMAKKVNDIVDNYYVNKMNLTGKMDKPEKNKIDILFSNHNSTIDFLILTSLIYKFDIPNYYFIFKESIGRIPIIGSCMIDDIKLKRNWDEDKDSILDQLNNIESGIIIIYPEGTRYDKKKHKESRKFCKKNKLPIFNYTLAPRVKGSHLIINALKETNRLGNIYDITLTFDNFIKQELYLTKIFRLNDLGPLTVNIKKINFNKNDLDYEKFKEKMFKLWLVKNNFIDNIYRKQLSLSI